jgi:hypothetical protein
MMDSVLREDSSFPRSSLDSAWAESEQYAENVSLGSLFMNATCKLLGNKGGVFVSTHYHLADIYANSW